MAEQKKLQEKDLEPKLLIPNYQGGHFQEYIPPDYSYLSQRLRDYYAAYRSKLGFQLYYWQLRFMFRPKERKVYDLNFMMHIDKDHDGKPEMLMERIHYYFARQKYLPELNFIKSMDTSDWRMEYSKDVYLQKHPYIKAYKQNWIKNFNESPNWKLLYHGVHILEIGPILDKLKIKSDYRHKHFLRYEKKTSEAVQQKVSNK